ncbi:MAG: ribonuclease N [Actinomycetota bacterium]|nr:ribonuclease N [Actinomycetota bacterium]
MSSLRLPAAAVLGGLVVLGAALLLPGPATTEPPAARLPATAEATEPVPGLPVVEYAELPEPARDTIALARAGGPFPYEQDGDVFANRELLLPTHAYGYYREYTVPTPGSGDRGARRIVAGSSGELYYSDDHYDSFVRVHR